MYVTLIGNKNFGVSYERDKENIEKAIYKKEITNGQW